MVLYDKLKSNMKRSKGLLPMNNAKDEWFLVRVSGFVFLVSGFRKNEVISSFKVPATNNQQPESRNPKQKLYCNL